MPITDLVPVFEPLQAHHDRKAFDCGKHPLSEFLQRHARQNADRNLGVTYVAVAVAGDSKILAYYTLVTREIESALIPAKGLPKHGGVGVVLLGRLAVDISAQGQRLGRICLARVIAQVETAAREIGIYALVLDAIDEDARNWYLQLGLGFETLLDDPNHLYLPVATIRQLSIP